MKADDQSEGIDPGLTISNTTPYFNSNDQYIFIALQPPVENLQQKPDAVKVDIWSYQDSVTQFTQLFQKQNPWLIRKQEYLAAINSAENRIIRILYDDESFAQGVQGAGDLDNGNFVVVSDKLSVREEWWETKRSTYLVSLKNGNRKLLSKNNTNQYFFFPGNKYLCWYDGKDKNYYSYNLSTNVVNNITKSIPEPLDDEALREASPNGTALSVGVCGWLDNETLLVYDNYDIWAIDLSSGKSPVNFTNGYGKRNNIKLRLINEDPFSTDERAFSAINSQKKILLTAFNVLNKENGFFTKEVHKPGDPKLLTMAPSSIYWLAFYGQEASFVRPVKAKNVKMWIVARSNATEAPDLYITSDFINYNRLTNIQPQNPYNWLTTEIFTFNQLDGITTQGILYKPEDFDSKKKYPIIFTYYEKKSTNLHVYRNPVFAGGEINIPWFVSRGYLVFTPDIYYTVGKTGQSVFNSIVASAQFMCRMPWVDASRMGITGQSFGGYETQYLVTHTPIFSAAVATSGISNFISFLRTNFSKN